MNFTNLNELASYMNSSEGSSWMGGGSDTTNKGTTSMSGLETIGAITGIAGGATGVASGLSSLFGSDDSSPDYVESPTERWQRGINALNLSTKLHKFGLNTSDLYGKNLIKLIKSGVFDDPEFTDPANWTWQGPTYAELTDNQKSGIASIQTVSDPSRVSAGMSSFAQGSADRLAKYGLSPILDTANPLSDVPAKSYNEYLTSNQADLDTNKAAIEAETARLKQPVTLDLYEAYQEENPNKKKQNLQNTQTVGENGPEVVTATQPTVVMPVSDRQQGSTALREDAVNPLAVESNTVGADPDELLKKTKLPGMATGGYLETGQSAVVGENGPETLVNATTAATQRALSGEPSAAVNSQTTQDFIKKSIADPARKNFQENTKQTINAAYAGPGTYWGSARAKATTNAAQDVEDTITAQGAQYAYADEQARRSLAENAANRSLSAVNTSLSVQNNPLAQEATRANIGATQAGTQATQFATQRGQALLPGEVQSQQANIQSTLASTSLTQANQQRALGLIQQDIATTGQINASTQAQLKQMGLTDAQIAQVQANTRATNMQADYNAWTSEQELALGSLGITQYGLQLMNDQLMASGLITTEIQNQINAAIANAASYLSGSNITV